MYPPFDVTSTFQIFRANRALQPDAILSVPGARRDIRLCERQLEDGAMRGTKDGAKMPAR